MTRVTVMVATARIAAQQGSSIVFARWRLHEAQHNGSLDPHELDPQTASRSVQLTDETNRQTDRPRDVSVAIVRIYALSACDAG